MRPCGVAGAADSGGVGRTGRGGPCAKWSARPGGARVHLAPCAALEPRWSDDEAVAYRLVSNELHFFDGKAPTQQAVHKLRVEGIAK